MSRLSRLERLNRLRTGPQRFRIPYGKLKTLPDDYTGLRHVVAVRQIPPEELPAAERAENWFEWEERPGPGPAEDAGRVSDKQIIRVSCVERKGLLGG